MLSAVWLIIFFHVAVSSVESFFQRHFSYNNNSCSYSLFFHIVTASMPYTFQCIQTSGYHFIILVVSFSECAIVYQVLVPYLLFILLNTHVTCTIFLLPTFNCFFPHPLWFKHVLCAFEGVNYVHHLSMFWRTKYKTLIICTPTLQKHSHFKSKYFEKWIARAVCS